MDHIPPERIIAFQDDEIEKAEADAIRRHLETCVECRTVHRNLADLDERVRTAAPATAGLLKGSIPESLDHALDDRTRSLLEASPSAAAPSKQRTRSILLRAASTAAAAALLALAFFMFPRTPERKAASWEIKPCRPETAPLIRGEERKQFRFHVTLSRESYFYILDVDASGGLSFIYPYLSETRSNDFGVKGPFRNGAEIRVPPEGIEGFELESEHLFLIPAETPLNAGNLREVLRALQDEYEAAEPDARAVKILLWLENRFPGTLYKRYGNN